MAVGHLLSKKKTLFIVGQDMQLILLMNQMELTAAIKAIEFVDSDEVINIFTDSNYVKNGITSWIKKWKKNNWINSSKQPVKNKKLWERLDEF